MRIIIHILWAQTEAGKATIQLRLHLKYMMGYGIKSFGILSDGV